MPVPASINDLSTVAGSNSPPGSESPATLDDYLRAHASFIAQLRDSNAAKQPLDATLTALAGVTTAADKLIYATGADAFATTDLSAFIRTLLDDANAATARATLGANDATNLTTGTLPDARISSSGPTTPTLLNSFVDSAATRYWKVGGIVYVSIDVTRTTTPNNGTGLFTLPAGFRPAVFIGPNGVFGQTSPLAVGAAGLRVDSSSGGVTVQSNAGGTPGSSGYSLTALFSFPAA